MKYTAAIIINGNASSIHFIMKDALFFFIVDCYLEL